MWVAQAHHRVAIADISSPPLIAGQGIWTHPGHNVYRLTETREVNRG